MLGRHYKDHVQRASEPVARALLRARLRPNHLTIMGLGVSCLAAVAFAQGRLRVAAGLLIIAALFDFFDGALARLASQVTFFGAFLDSVVDRYSDMVVLAGIVFLYRRLDSDAGILVALIAAIGTVMVSYTKARAQSIGLACDVGLMERPERLIVLIAGAVFDLLLPAMAVLAVLTNTTALQRIIHVRGAARQVRGPVPHAPGALPRVPGPPGSPREREGVGEAEILSPRPAAPGS
jgi:CDP-diacylglycerol---glycerol-3-phosphate 3-phosphatidyltransferase